MLTPCVMGLDVDDGDQVGGVDGLFDDFELQAVDLNAIAGGATTPPLAASNGRGTTCTGDEFDDTTFAMAIQARLEAAMHTAVQEIAAENGSELEVVKTDGGLEIVNQAAGNITQGNQRPPAPGGCCACLTPAPGGMCAALVGGVLHALSWCSHALAAADFGFDIAFAASIAAEHPGYATLLIVMAVLGILVGSVGHYNRRYNPEIKAPGTANGAVSLAQVPYLVLLVAGSPENSKLVWFVLPELAV